MWDTYLMKDSYFCLLCVVKILDATLLENFKWLHDM